MAYDAELLSVPDFEYSGDYYPQIAARIRRLNRVRVPELTNEDEHELFIQAERSFSLMAHYNNTLLDLVANSLFLNTAKIPESAKSILQLIGSDLFPANPSQVDMLATLSSRYSGATRILEAFRKFATKRTPDYPEIVFENMTALDLTARTDDQALTYGYGLVWDRGSAALTAYINSLESDIVYDASAPFATTDVGNYLLLVGSTLGNDLDYRRILEVSDEVGGAYRKVRLENASFTTETGVGWEIFSLSANAADDWNANIANNPFGGTMHTGDIIYIGHPNIMWDRVDVELSPSASVGYKSVWEFYDPLENTTHPTAVSVGVPGVGQMTIDVTSLLGTNDVSGAFVEIEYIPSGAKFRKESSFGGMVNRIVIDSYLGQMIPSSAITDYIVRCDWRPLPDMVDATATAQSSWLANGKFEFTLPRTQSDSWYKYRIYDPATATLNSAFYLRLRIVDPSASPPIIPSRVRIDRNHEYVLARLVQGKTVEERNLSSNGQANQAILLRRKPYVWASARVFVTEGGTEYEWYPGSSFLRSRSTSRHCVIDPQTDGTALLKFGDGTSGRIPPVGNNNIRVTYRIGADENGNIGANTLTVNRDGVGAFSSITNARQGMYWIEPDWSSQLALEMAKVRSGRIFQTMQRSVAPSDAVALAQSFHTLSGSKIIARAKSYEESFGPKTIELVVVGGSSAAITDEEKTELTEYFNGGDIYGYDGISLYNSRVVVTNYIPKMIALNIRIECYPVITETLVRQLLTYILSPTAIESNGRNYMWRFGQSVTLSRIASEIFKMSPGNVFDVDFDPTATDFALIARELPMFDAVGSNITVIGPTFEE